MNQGEDRETKIKAWVDHKIETGEATVHLAGSHMVGRKTTFQQRLNSCRDIEELEGFANRRRFDPTLQRWSDDERAAIITRKTEMTNVKRKRK
jgi:O-methyltransferase involved in polyketide biosynthesis